MDVLINNQGLRKMLLNFNGKFYQRRFRHFSTTKKNNFLKIIIIIIRNRPRDLSYCRPMMLPTAATCTGVCVCVCLHLDHIYQQQPRVQAGDTCEPEAAPPSVIVVVVLRDKDVVLLQQRSKILADPSPHI